MGGKRSNTEQEESSASSSLTVPTLKKARKDDETQHESTDASTSSLMLNHIVLMCFKDDLQAEAVLEVMAELKNLKESISEIKSFSEGTNCSTEGFAKGFTHGFTIQFNNEADRDAYLIHPNHVRVTKKFVVPNLKNGLDSLLVFDYVEKNAEYYYCKRAKKCFSTPGKTKYESP
jgi:hypothetical protein